ncbi:MAG: hypothetical protein AAFV45_00900 [Pseudomonadota bacterium]
MRRHRTFAAGLLGAAVLAISASGAQAGCVSKAAEATSTDEASAKWFALETMVQSVSWGLWPAFVATGSVPGYTIAKQSYKCSPADAGVKCVGKATFCSS